MLISQDLKRGQHIDIAGISVRFVKLRAAARRAGRRYPGAMPVDRFVAAAIAICPGSGLWQFYRFSIDMASLKSE